MLFLTVGQGCKQIQCPVEVVLHAEHRAVLCDVYLPVFQQLAVLIDTEIADSEVVVGGKLAALAGVSSISRSISAPPLRMLYELPF